MKKILCVVLAFVLVLGLTACTKGVQKLGDDGVYYFGSKEGQKKLEASFNPLNPTNVFSNTTYNEQMLYGAYELSYLDKNIEKFAENATFEDVQFSETYSFDTAEENLVTQKLTTLPVKVYLGHANNNYARKLRGEHEWASLYLVNERGYAIEVLCTYTVSGNTISFFPLDGYEEVLGENYLAEKILYKVGEDSLDYTFELRGTSLKLTRDGQSITLTSRYFANNGIDGLDVGGYAAVGSPRFDGVDSFSGGLDRGYESVYLNLSDKLFDLVEKNVFSANYDNACIYMSEDGQISFYWESKDADGNVQEHLHHFVYYGLGGSSIVMTDGDKVYYYTENYLSRSTATLGEGMTEEEQIQLAAMDEDKIEQIAQKKADLLSDLAAAYEAAGLNVSINTQTGEIALDSTVLFDYNASTISAEGQAFLQQFTQIYTSTVYSEKYADFVSRILVEGHTDTDGTYERNLELSQERADNVLNYCLSAECGVDSAYADLFAQSAQAVGYSYDKPVYDVDGNVDMDASRRVSFRFVINLAGIE